ncbi:MAG TPA: PRTRC system ThiF family protein, partial [Cyclobacteriaceae bacterium]|nr:PRTRC system ThiF family protein [Cyclobacteriaceae bacterium]
AHSYILNPVHPVTVTLIGTGGTGSHVLSSLARFNAALVALGHPGLMVTAFDNDIVTHANLGRQMFSIADLNENKAVTLISRINRFFGLAWRAVPEHFSSRTLEDKSIDCPVGNIIISCVDSLQTRKAIRQIIKGESKIAKNRESYKRPLYWMDFGNGQNNGQFVLSTLTYGKKKQPGTTAGVNLPDVFDLFPQMKKMKDQPDAISCSMHESLLKQDLFVNSILAQNGVHLLWKLFRETKINYHGQFINVANGKANPIMVS